MQVAWENFVSLRDNKIFSLALVSEVLYFYRWWGKKTEQATRQIIDKPTEPGSQD